MEGELKDALASAKARTTGSGAQHRRERLKDRDDEPLLSWLATIRRARPPRRGGRRSRSSPAAPSAPVPGEPSTKAGIEREHAARPRRAAGDETPPGGESLREFYASVEGDLTASGRMRRETAPADAPFTDADLIRDFDRIALHDEYVDLGGRFVHSRDAGAAPPLGQAGARRGDDRRLDPARGRRPRPRQRRRLHPAPRAPDRRSTCGSARGTDVNFLVLFMTSAERDGLRRPGARALYPNFAPAVMQALRDTPLDTFCTAYAFSEPAAPSIYSAVIVLIRAEHPPFTRLSCVHEEMAQAMGLPNDSPEARPSLFNDELGVRAPDRARRDPACACSTTRASGPA